MNAIYDYFKCLLYFLSVFIMVAIGKYEEAFVYFKEALGASRSILGNTHPDTLVYINNVGNVLKAQGKRI